MSVYFVHPTGTGILDYNRDGVKDKEFHFGTKGDIPVIGDWDGNGISDAGSSGPPTGTGTWRQPKPAW